MINPNFMNTDLGLNALIIEINNAQTHIAPLDRADLIKIAQRVLHAEGIAAAEISIALVDNAMIHEINRRHLDVR